MCEADMARPSCAVSFSGVVIDNNCIGQHERVFIKIQMGYNL